MLAVKNLTKIYHSKKSEDVVALNNVSLSFNETGMVFLLGKSGSGKSTLLNVLGGLDKFDGGEIIIKGKSSKDFKERDFDSYRNTYLGFIFQEYNILNDFTVYKNIALALELQGKKSSKENVEQLLEQVDLKGFAKRKPNELSGGQKQRIAIARALIKEPDIIMADEPTGALDSATGKQVFDTLKKLSQQKLVIVVSHDREFAEQYADRIIELKDGQVISDVTKRTTPPVELSSGFKLIADNKVYIEKGHKLTQEEANKLNELLSNAKGDVILSADEEANKNFKAISKIDEHGNSEYFNETKAEDLHTDCSSNDFKLIKSKLKYKDSLKMGASGLKTKKVRLFFTILLSAIALTLFGIADTMASFNVAKCNYESLTNLGATEIAIGGSHTNVYDDYYYTQKCNVSEAGLLSLKEKFPDYTFVAVRDYTVSLHNLTSSNITNSAYYPTETTGVVYITGTEFAALNKTMLTGRLPSASGEIAITSNQLETFKKYGLSGYDEDITQNNIVGKNITFDNNTYTIVGVVDQNFDKSRYEVLSSNIANMDMSTYMLLTEYTTKLNSGFNNVFFVSEADLSRFENQSDIVRSNSGGYFSIDGSSLKSSAGFNYAYYENYYSTIKSEDLSAGIIYFDENQTELGSDEVVLGAKCFQFSGTNDEYGNYYFDLNLDINRDYVYDYDTNKYVQTEQYVLYIYTSYESNYEEIITYESLEELAAGVRSIFSKFFNDTCYVSFEGSDEKIKVAGIYFDDINSTNSSLNSSIIFKDSASIPSYLQFIFGEYSMVVTALKNDYNSDYALVSYLSEYNANHDNLVIRSEVSDTLENFSSMIETMAKVFLYIGIGFAVFAALMLMNFIGISISYKKKEIGILRALGARGSDVYGIFFNESLIITLINYLVSIVLTIVGVYLINYFMTSEIGLNLTLLTFGIRQVLVLLVVSLVVAIIASFLPTHRISRMKPVDAILGRK